MSVVATTKNSQGPLASTQIGSGGGSTSRSRTQSIDHHHPATAPQNVTQTTKSADPESRDSISHGLDFIGTGGAVKKLFSIPLSEESVCVAVHNIHGTLLVDEVVPEEYYDEDGESSSSITPPISDGDTAQPLPPSSQSLALALALSPSSDGEDLLDGPLSLLSKMIQKSSLEETTTTSSRLRGDLSSSSWIMPRITPSSVRDYVEWQFQDMNLLVGSDALIVRPDHDGVGGGDGVIVRVEEVQKLRRMAEWEQAQRLAQDEKTQDAGGHSTKEQKEKQLSYADVLVQSAPARALLTNSSAQNDNEASSSSSSDTAPKQALNLDQVQLQTCIVPTSGPLGGWLTTSPPSSSEQSDVSFTTTLEPTSSPGSSKCIVLDAYLDNLMANVPQLALCLQEKGLIQSVKLLDRDQIPTMMMHSSTLDTTKPIETMHEKNASSSSSPDLFSPEIMEMNATALLRFLKANCSTNNTTYLLRTDGPNTNNIQLYDISSISQQRQKKWIWWLATMSYRFALRLRQLESHGVLPMHQRSFRDRQRNLLQTTLDLLQDLSDMDGNAHESMVASVREHLADTFLGETTATDAATEINNPDSNATTPTASPPPVMASQHPPVVTTPAPPVPVGTRSQPTDPQQHQPYSAISTDALNKAHDHLISGIKALTPILESQIRPPKAAPVPARRRKRAGASTKATTQPEPPSPAMVSQLFGLNHKLVNVTLRLAEHYLGQYSSSSAMQSLRHAARRMADSIALLEYILSADEWLSPLRLQYTWLWEHCGHFARSFASDDLWRDRGHATGDDVLYVLKDVESAFVATFLPYNFSNLPDPMKAKTKGVVSLQTVSAIYSPKLGELKRDKVPESPAWEEARKYLSNQGLLQRDKRQVLVASCISYQRAIVTFEEIADENQRGFDGPSPILNLLRQRLGDACNEIGKALLASLRSFLSKPPPQSSGLGDVLLDSAQFWFLEGLEAFEVSGDPRNIALLRCNLCQCCKLRANASFSSQAPVDSSVSHAEVCLEKAASHLQAAHETLGTRDVDPMTWDMVSNELAATFLVLAVRRRQSLLGGGAAPVLLEALRLSPGKERSIIEPMEKSLAIYEQAGNLHQAAAVQYQLALTNSKVWTCQRDETKTREKLSAAFSQYQNAFAYFSSHLRGNEPTFVLLCLDIASLYAAVSGEECLAKALTRCLDTVEAFSADAIAAAGSSSQWLEQMETLAGSVDDRIFKLLRNLAKVEDSQKWKDLYRVGLSAKMTQKTSNPKMNALESVHGVMIALRANFNDNK